MLSLRLRSFSPYTTQHTRSSLLFILLQLRVCVCMCVGMYVCLYRCTDMKSACAFNDSLLCTRTNLYSSFNHVISQVEIFFSLHNTTHAFITTVHSLTTARVCVYVCGYVCVSVSLYRHEECVCVQRFATVHTHESLLFVQSCYLSG